MILKAACGIHKYAKLLANKQKSISVTHWIYMTIFILWMF
jgi:hypothetical protein